MSSETSASIYTLDFSDITHEDVGRVGGKNASLGEMFRALKPKGVGVLDGFATTADAYRFVLGTDGLEEKLRSIFQGLDAEDLTRLSAAGHAARAAVEQTPLPDDLTDAILAGVRSTVPASRSGARDWPCGRQRRPRILPEASFAGAAETFLNVRGRDGVASRRACLLLLAVHGSRDQLPRAARIRPAEGGAVGRRHADGAFRQGQFRGHLHARHRIGLPRCRHRLGRLRPRRVRRPGGRHARRMDGLQADAGARAIAPSSAAGSARKKCGWSTPTAPKARAASRPRPRSARGSV